MNDAAIERMLHAKLAFLNAQTLASRNFPAYDGLAILGLHDSVELALRAGAHARNVQVKPRSGFENLMDTVAGAADMKVPDRPRLVVLNQIRNAFKHQGIAPRRADVESLAPAVDEFLQEFAVKFLGISLSFVSMANLVERHRVRNHIHVAEELIAADNFEESLISSAQAYALITSSWTQAPHDASYNPTMDDWVRQVSRKFDALMFGVSLADHIRFESLTPKVNLSQAGTLHVVITKALDNDETTAQFCVDHATRTAIAVQDSGIRLGWTRASKRKIEVLKPAELFVYPIRDEKEVIRTVHQGEFLHLVDQPSKIDGYVHVLDGEDECYVKESALKQTEDSGQNSTEL